MTEEDRRAIREACRSFIEERCPVSQTREWMDGGPGADVGLWKEMAALGWAGALVPEEFGGSGLDLEFVAVVLEEIGRHLVPCPMASSALLVTSAILYAGSDEQRSTHLPALANGSRIATLAACTASGRIDGTDTQIVATRTNDGYALSGHADFVADLDVANLLLVAAREGDGPPFFLLIERDQDGATISQRRTVDMTRPLGRLELHGVTVPGSARLGASDDAALAERLTNLAALAIAADCAGGVQRSLEVGVEYAKNRVQFGRPIGSFQAVKHMLADMFVLAETCSAATRRAARMLLADPSDGATASLAKSVASDAYVEAVESAIRVHGAVGLTWEYDQHLYLKRARLNQRLFGDSAWHRERMLRSGQSGAEVDTSESRDTSASKAYRERVSAWLAAHLPADWEARRRSDRVAFDRWWARELHTGGHLVPRWPREHGGEDLSTELQLVFADEMQRASAPFPKTFYCALNHAGDAVREYGNDEQKERFLPKILGGETIWCQAFSEPNAGSDLANLQTSARREGDHYILNGQKTWSSGATTADRAILPARTDPDAPKRRGISYFLVDLRSPGIEIRSIRQMSGTTGFAEIFLNDVKVPVSDRLGDEGQGWSIVKSTLNSERGTGFIGFAAETRELVVALLADAHSRGLLFSNEPGWSDLREELAKEFAEAEIIDEFCQQLLNQLLETGEIGNVASLLKLCQSELMRRVTESALRVEGLEGLLFDGPVDSDSEEGDGWLFNHLNSWIFIIGGGTSEIQRNNISEGVLGLPREPQVKGA